MSGANKVWSGAAGLCVDERRRVLLVQQGKPGEGPAWGIPGGGRLEGETDEECCVREVWEETGYHVVPDRLVYVKMGPPLPGYVFRLTVFAARVTGGHRAIHDPDGIVHDVGWFSAGELDQLPFCFAEDRDLAARFLRMVGGAPDGLPPVRTAGAFVAAPGGVPFVRGLTTAGRPPGSGSARRTR